MLLSTYDSSNGDIQMANGTVNPFETIAITTPMNTEAECRKTYNLREIGAPGVDYPIEKIFRINVSDPTVGPTPDWPHTIKDVDSQTVTTLVVVEP